MVNNAHEPYLRHKEISLYSLSTVVRMSWVNSCISGVVFPNFYLFTTFPFYQSDLISFQDVSERGLLDRLLLHHPRLLLLHRGAHRAGLSRTEVRWFDRITPFQAGNGCPNQIAADLKHSDWLKIVMGLGADICTVLYISSRIGLWHWLMGPIP